MKLEFTESLTDATRSSVSSAQHRSSLLTLILSNSCTAAFVPVWSLVVISGLLTSNTYVPLSIGVRHRFLKDSSETHGLSRVFRLKNRVYTWVFLAETYYLLEQRRIIHATNFQNFQIPIYAFLNSNTVAHVVNLILFAECVYLSTSLIDNKIDIFYDSVTVLKRFTLNNCYNCSSSIIFVNRLLLSYFLSFLFST